MKSGLSRISLVLLLIGALAGCQRQASRPPCPTGQHCLEYGNTLDPSTLDPQKATLTSEAAIIRELMQGLMTSAPDGAPIAGLATRWETSPDGLVWTFHLRPALWSDGKPVTADDFVFAYRRILDPNTASSYAYLLYVLKGAQAINAGKAGPETLGATAVDSETLRLDLAHPAPYLPQLLQHQSYFPVPAHVVRQWRDAWTKPGHFVGDGAYRLVSWRLGDYVRVERNPHFYDAARIYFDRIDFYPTQDAVSAERRVERGELDINNSIQSSRVSFLRRRPRAAPLVRSHPYLSITYLAFNVKGVPVLRDPRVRRALSMAIDRDFLTKKLLRAGQIPTTAFVPPQIAGYLPPATPHPRADWADWPLAHRQAEARRLLRAAGYDERHPFRLQLKSGNSNGTLLIVQAIQADLRGIGVDLTLVQEDGQVAYQSFEAGDFQVGVFAWIADFNDPLTYLILQKSDTGPQNYGGYNNQTYDALLEAADQEKDGAKRAAILAKAEQIMLDDNYIVPLYNGVNLNLVSPNIAGWVDNAIDAHPALYLHAAARPPTGPN